MLCATAFEKSAENNFLLFMGGGGFSAYIPVFH
jgi:hypothetical protein